MERLFAIFARKVRFLQLPIGHGTWSAERMSSIHLESIPSMLSPASWAQFTRNWPPESSGFLAWSISRLSESSSAQRHCLTWATFQPIRALVTKRRFALSQLQRSIALPLVAHWPAVFWCFPITWLAGRWLVELGDFRLPRLQFTNMADASNVNKTSRKDITSTRQPTGNDNSQPDLVSVTGPPGIRLNV